MAFLSKKSDLVHTWAAKTSQQAPTKITRGLLQLHLWNSNEPIIHSNAFTYPTRLKLSGHFTLTSLYTGFWLKMREIHKYLRENNKCPQANLPAGSILLASLASDADFKCPLWHPMSTLSARLILTDHSPLPIPKRPYEGVS